MFLMYVTRVCRVPGIILIDAGPHRGTSEGINKGKSCATFLARLSLLPSAPSFHRLLPSTPGWSEASSFFPPWWCRGLRGQELQARPPN